MPVFGPGTLQIGAVGSEIDVECLINGCRITSSKDEADSTTKLCGTVKPGKITYTYSMTGNVDIDTPDAAGLFNLSQTAPGTEQSFTFTPNTADGTAAAGTLIIDPLDFGADAYGDDMTSDFEFSIVGAPVYTMGPAVPGDDVGAFVVNGRQARGANPIEEPADASAESEAA
jgi:hypothetical protein